MVLCNGSQWVSGWVLGQFLWGFGSRWVAGWLMVSCEVAHGELRGGSRWVCGVARGGGFHFWSIPVVLGVGFFFVVLRSYKHTI